MIYKMMQRFDHTDSSASHVYYDITIRNYVSKLNDDSHEQLKFYETRSTPIVEHANQYKLSIVRFQIDTYSLPSYVAEIEPNQSNPNLMIQSVTLEYYDGVNTYNSQVRHLRWSKVDNSISTPVAPNQTPSGFQVDSPYYFCFDYEHVLSLVNRALREAMADLVLIDATLAPIPAPYLVWDVPTNSAVLYARESLFDSTSALPNIKIYFNRSLYSLFSTFPVIKYPITNELNKTYQLVVDSFNGSKVVIISINPYIRVPQYAPTFMNMSPVSSIVFTSNTLPIVPNQLNSPQIFQNNNLVQLSTTSNSFSNIITDMSTNDMYRPELTYNPSAEYRFVSLVNPGPINQVDIQVYWKDKTSRLRPFYLSAGASCSLKLLFQRIY
jgi:hypothetical protein